MSNVLFQSFLEERVGPCLRGLRSACDDLRSAVRATAESFARDASHLTAGLAAIERGFVSTEMALRAAQMERDMQLAHAQVMDSGAFQTKNTTPDAKVAASDDKEAKTPSFCENPDHQLLLATLDSHLRKLDGAFSALRARLGEADDGELYFSTAGVSPAVTALVDFVMHLLARLLPSAEVETTVTINDTPTASGLRKLAEQLVAAARVEPSSFNVGSCGARHQATDDVGRKGAQQRDISGMSKRHQRRPLLPFCTAPLIDTTPLAPCVTISAAPASPRPSLPPLRPIHAPPPLSGVHKCIDATAETLAQRAANPTWLIQRETRRVQRTVALFGRAARSWLADERHAQKDETLMLRPTASNTAATLNDTSVMPCRGGAVQAQNDDEQPHGRQTTLAVNDRGAALWFSPEKVSHAANRLLAQRLQQSAEMVTDPVRSATRLRIAAAKGHHRHPPRHSDECTVLIVDDVNSSKAHT